MKPTGPTPHAPAKVALRSKSGKLLGRRNGLITRVTRGTVGEQVIIRVGEGLTLVVSRADGTSSGNLDVQIALAGLSGNSAKQLLQFLEAMAKAAVVEIQGALTLKAEINTKRNAPEPPFVELAEDLAFIEDRLGVTFSFPEYLPGPKDRVLARVVRLILAGKAAFMPGGKLTAVLSGEIDETVEELLLKGADIRGSNELWSMNVVGELLELEDVNFIMANASPRDGQAHLDALRAGTGAGREVEFVDPDGSTGVVLFLPHRVKGKQVPAPSRWNLTDIEEAPPLR